MLTFAAASYAITVLTAAVIVFRWERAESFTEVLAWQAFVYGLWLPMAAFVWNIFKRRGLSARAIFGFILLGLVAVPAHAFFATFIDITFGSADLVALAVARFQIDTLTYSAFGLVAIAAALRRRADKEAQAAAEIAGALAIARKQMASGAASDEAKRLLVATGSKRIVVATSDVEWFGSAGNYVVVNWAAREGLLRRTLGSLEQELDPLVFARSHRGTIVNLSRVTGAEAVSDGSWRLSLQSGAEVVVSRTYREEILRRLNPAEAHP
jgi:DNA-binding LytR/AlgR family response regulator